MIVIYLDITNKNKEIVVMLNISFFSMLWTEECMYKYGQGIFYTNINGNIKEDKYKINE